MSRAAALSNLQAALQPLLQAQPTVSAMATIFHDDKVIESHIFGPLKAENISAVLAPRFPIYSLTKSLIAVVALAMRDAGVLDLHAPIAETSARRLPTWLGSKSLHELLTHRSGLTDYGQMSRYHEDVRRRPSQAESFEVYFEAALSTGSPVENEEEFLYSNIGYRLVREILERVSYLTLPQLVKKYISDLLPIEHQVDLQWLEGVSPALTEGHSPYLAKSAPDIRGLYDFSWVYHGVFSARAADVVAIFSNLESLVSEKSLVEMTALRSLNIEHPALNPAYGIGLMGDLHFKNGGIYGHSGGGPGFSTACYHQPSSKRTICTMINRDSVLPAEALAFAYLSSAPT